MVLKIEGKLDISPDVGVGLAVMDKIPLALGIL